mmetsp:Transcript_17515/g.59873  ORF Transcript_17515/g.59873 Transcript_17515/m.59873 type:complete len:767 (+) Transcript_17515:897-3197(+)
MCHKLVKVAVTEARNLALQLHRPDGAEGRLGQLARPAAARVVDGHVVEHYAHHDCLLERRTRGRDKAEEAVRGAHARVRPLPQHAEEGLYPRHVDLHVAHADDRERRLPVLVHQRALLHGEHLRQRQLHGHHESHGDEHLQHEVHHVVRVRECRAPVAVVEPELLVRRLQQRRAPLPGPEAVLRQVGRAHEPLPELLAALLAAAVVYPYGDHEPSEVHCALHGEALRPGVHLQGPRGEGPEEHVRLYEAPPPLLAPRPEGLEGCHGARHPRAPRLLRPPRSLLLVAVLPQARGRGHEHLVPARHHGLGVLHDRHHHGLEALVRRARGDEEVLRQVGDVVELLLAAPVRVHDPPRRRTLRRRDGEARRPHRAHQRGVLLRRLAPPQHLRHHALQPLLGEVKRQDVGVERQRGHDGGRPERHAEVVVQVEAPVRVLQEDEVPEHVLHQPRAGVHRLVQQQLAHGQQLDEGHARRQLPRELVRGQSARARLVALQKALHLQVAQDEGRAERPAEGERGAAAPRPAALEAPRVRHGGRDARELDAHPRAQALAHLRVQVVLLAERELRPDGALGGAHRVRVREGVRGVHHVRLAERAELLGDVEAGHEHAHDPAVRVVDGHAPRPQPGLHLKRAKLLPRLGVGEAREQRVLLALGVGVAHNRYDDHPQGHAEAQRVVPPVAFNVRGPASEHVRGRQRPHLRLAPLHDEVGEVAARAARGGRPHTPGAGEPLRGHVPPAPEAIGNLHRAALARVAPVLPCHCPLLAALGEG